MKYYLNYNPYSWTQYENSTQNSTSNIRGYKQQIIHKKSNRRRRKSSFYSSISSNHPSISTYSNQSAGHYQFYVGETLGGIYTIQKLMGQGTFGRVVECTANQKKYAVKIIRPVQRYIRSAKIQKNILKQINSKDKDDNQGIVRYVHSFYHNQHYCLVFKPLGQSLYDVIKLNQYQGFPISYVQSYFKQILKTIGFLHRIGYTHTDLKPENILLEEKDLIKYQGFASTTQQIYLPKSDKVRVIDFGGATKYNEFHSSVICTRQYRPPEVILKCTQWNEIADVWSIGCIIIELFTGNLLFPTHNDFEHLIMIEKNSGKFPGWMLRKSDDGFKQVFERDEISYKKAEKYLTNWRNINNLQTIDGIFSEYEQLIDLLKKCLQIDPNRRINCKKALEHGFFRIEYK